MKKDIEAKHDSKTEHKVTFYIDGQKYGFRCDDALMKALALEDGQEIQYLDHWGMNLVEDLS